MQTAGSPGAGFSGRTEATSQGKRVYGGEEELQGWEVGEEEWEEEEDLMPDITPLAADEAVRAPPPLSPTQPTQLRRSPPPSPQLPLLTRTRCRY